MASQKHTADFVLHQLGLPDRFTVKAMFGEYALYADGKPVAFICDDQLFVKRMAESLELEGRCELAPAYPGSKDHYLVPEEMITGDHRLPGVLLRMAEVLPFPKARRKATGRARP
jgi:TfoX/Sxy family transcriptional regulator of competence genes